MRKIDPELFWMIFSLCMVLIVLYMAYTYRTEVTNAVNAMCNSTRPKFDIHGSMNASEVPVSILNITK